MAGRPPKPTALKILEGNTGHRPLPTNEPTPPVGLGNTPSDMTDAAKAIWRKYAPILEQTKVGTRADAATFEAFCRSFALWRQLRKEGECNPIVKVNGQPVPNPMLQRSDKEHKTWSAAAIQLGLTPAARTRIAAQEADEPDDALALFAMKRTAPTPTPTPPAGGEGG